MWQNNASFEEDSAKYAERMKYLPRYIPRLLGPKKQRAPEEPLTRTTAGEKLLVKKYLEIIGLMQRAGVKLMTGSGLWRQPASFSRVGRSTTRWRFW